MEQVDDMEYELLLVNDGSSDDTLEKMQKLAEKHKDKVLFFFQGILAKKRQFMQDYVMQRVTMLLQWMLICRIHQNCCQRC